MGCGAMLPGQMAEAGSDSADPGIVEHNGRR